MIYLARSLARLGHSVVVGAPGTPGIFDGAEYVHFQNDLNRLLQEQWDVLIMSRWVEALNNYPWNAQTILFWSHDLPAGPVSLKCHGSVFLTEFHSRHWQVPPDVGYIVGDGVDLSLFAGTEPIRNENVLLWTSNPDRGLALAAKIFNEHLRPKWPDLELHVYGRSSVYGWPPENEGPFVPRREHEENVFLHEPLTKAGLAKALREAWAVFYPTYWPETYCIATLEAQAAGTPVIASPYGALVETVEGGILTYDFPNAVSQLRNKNRWEKLSKLGQEHASTRDWDHRAEEWLKVIEKVRLQHVPAPTAPTTTV